MDLQAGISFLQQFDYQTLQQGITKAARQAFLGLQALHPDENFYVFGFYTHPLIPDVRIMANTEEGLTRRAEEYLRMDYYKNYTLEEMRLDLRYSAADAVYCLPEIHHDLLAAFDNQLGDLHDIRHEVWSELTDQYGTDEKAFDETEEYDNRIRNVLFGALRQLDQEGVFGVEAKRQVVVINLFMTDQSDYELIEYAKQVNPPEILERFKIELAQGHAIFERHQGKHA